MWASLYSPYGIGRDLGGTHSRRRKHNFSISLQSTRSISRLHLEHASKCRRQSWCEFCCTPVANRALCMRSWSCLRAGRCFHVPDATCPSALKCHVYVDSMLVVSDPTESGAQQASSPHPLSVAIEICQTSAEVSAHVDLRSCRGSTRQRTTCLSPPPPSPGAMRPAAAGLGSAATPAGEGRRGNMTPACCAPGCSGS